MPEGDQARLLRSSACWLSSSSAHSIEDRLLEAGAPISIPIAIPTTGNFSPRVSGHLERGLLFLADSKTGKKTVILNAPASAVLAGLDRIGAYVVPGDDPEKPRADLKRPWETVNRRPTWTLLRLKSKSLKQKQNCLFQACSIGVQQSPWAGPEFWAAIGQDAAAYPVPTASGAFHNIVVATIGNLVGGSLMVGAVYWFVYLRRRAQRNPGSILPQSRFINPRFYICVRIRPESS